MFRTKKDVDRHVQDIFRKLQDENERTLRCHKIAELYYHVGDFESARRYLSRYVEVRKEAKAHKLMGQILESLGQKEAALIQYKFSFELDGRQEELVLKICELLADPDVAIDVNRAKYWSERGDKLFPRHKVVFQLKEKILSTERPTNNEEDLEKLILSELAARPTDVQLRVKLLKRYMDKNKFDEAYKHATDIEATNIHRDSLMWYQVLCELFLKCKNSKQLNWTFWMLYISSLERYAALSLKEHGNTAKKVSEAMQAVYNFDQYLFEAKAQSFSSYPSLTESIFIHMWGQLHFHLACLLLQNTMRDQSSWSETGKLCAPLLLTAMHVKPIDLTASWASHADSSMKNQLQLWYREGSYRCSQAGHVLHDYAKSNQKKLINTIEKFCTGTWRERIYQRIFVGKIYQKIRTSYFTNNNGMNPPLRLISHHELKKFDEVAEEVWPYSLHHQIWPAIKNRSGSLHSNKHEGPLPNASSHLFPDLQFSVYNLSQASAVTLSRLDIDAFLNAAALCASAIIEEQQRNNLLNPDRLPTLPADLTNPLCSDDQEKWWCAAYKMYRRETMDDIGETRQMLQRGLEAVRCIGNHGLNPAILVHLARVFSYRAKQMKEKNPESSDIPALEARSELYWSAAIPLLERLQNNQTIRTSHIKLFEYIGKEMNNMELSHAIEEGKLLLAQKLVKDKFYEQAIEALHALKCPEASFEQGKIYQILADETMNSLPKESVTSEIRSQHTIILSKARNCFYLTLDRLRSPDADPKHPLNAELCTHITAIENELKRIDPDTLYTDRNRNDCDDLSEESYSSAHSDEHAVVTNSLPIINNSIQTPMRNIRRTPRQSSTPVRNHDLLDLSRNRNEARPSPERLDAQVRQLVHSIESLKEQNREQHRAMIAKLDELIKISVRKETQSQKLQSQPQPQPQPQPSTVNRNLEEELYGLYGDDEYADYNNFNNTPLPTASANRTQNIVQNLFAQRHPYSPLVYPSPAATAAALQGYYQGGALSFPDPTAAAAAAASQHMPGLYPAAAAALSVYPMSPLYRGGLDQPINFMQQMTEKLEPGLFSQRLPSNQPHIDYSQVQTTQQQQSLSSPLQPPQQQSLTTQLQTQQQLQHQQQLQPQQQLQQQQQQAVNQAINSVINERLKTPVTPSPAQGFKPPNKDPPVNVVITTSDTLPTTAPAFQPNFSVTIPAQHRLGVTPTTPATTPTSSQQQLQSQDENAPHSYQISMPSQPTIPTTVNLPPLSTTLTITSPVIKSHVTDNQNTSIISTGSRHSISDHEVEHDPIPDFAPIIPLPDEVPVTTGEENEEELFCARAKLFRFVNKEWKERGIGNVKLLKNEDGKIRLLMRREQVLKICANHFLRKDMELTMMPNNDKAYMWVANDFADEELKLEKLCIRFKTPEEASSFKEHFDNAKNSLLDDSSKSTGVKSASSTSKPTLKTVTKVEPAQSKFEQVQNKGVEKIEGFTFTTPPNIRKVTAAADTPEQKKPEETAKPSPFASFSFKTPDSTSANKQPPTAPINTGFTFGVPTTTTASTPTFVQDPKLIMRRPHAPAPIDTLKETEKSCVEHGEVVVFEQSINLMHYSSDTKIWNEEGTGIIKILSEKMSGRVRLLMNNDDDSKTLYNQIIPTMTVFNLKSDTVNWTIGTDKNKSDTYMARFKNHDQASLFQKSIMDHLRKSAKPSVKPTNSVITTQKPLSELFKPAAGSWECKDCYTRNNASTANCVACQAPSPNVSLPRPTVQSVSKNLFDQFKPAPGSWECKDCYTRNNATAANCAACEAPAPETIKSASALTSVSTISTQEANQWKCRQCSIINSLSNQYCATCDTPKDPSMPPKPKSTGGFLINSQAPDAKTTYTFGMPQSTQPSATKDTPNFGFSFTKTSEKAVSSPINIFNSNKSSNDSDGFQFGTQPPSTPPSNISGGPFTFGSPGKSFDFQFHAKSPPIKSPERPETDDDEVVEQAEDVYFTPVIPLPDKVDVKTGEEDEEILYSHRAKIFKFDAATKEWKERGLGDIKLLKHAKTKKLRLLMRRDQVLKLCLNHAVTSSLEITAKDSKTWMWSAGDYSEGEIEYMQFACRFKTQEIAEEFKKAIDDACQSDDANTSISTTPTSKTVTSTTSKKEPTPDIEVVYEVKVSPEEKAAARKLKLPENFYAYKYKEDCPGCIGCRDSDESLFKDDKLKQKSTTEKPLASIFTMKPASTTQSIQPSSNIKMTFGTSSSIFGGGNSTFDAGDTANTTSFVFGSQPAAKPNSQETILENLKICSPTTKSQPSGTSTTTPNIFSTAAVGSDSTNAFNTSSTKSVFGTPSSTNSSLKSTIFSPLGTNTATTIENVFNKPSFGDAKSTAPTTTTSSNIFGNDKTPPSITATSTNIFGSPKPTVTSTSISVTSPSIFSSPKPTTNIFGGTTATTTSSIFGEAKLPTSNIFGSFNTSTTATTTPSIFGGTTNLGTTATTIGNIFINTPSFGTATTAPTTTASIFGGLPSFGTSTIATTTSSSIFGGTSVGTTTTTIGSIFGSTPTLTTATTMTSIFGGTTATTSSNSIFGSNTTSIFVGQTTITPTFGSLASQASAQGPSLGAFGTSGFGSDTVKSTSVPTTTTNISVSAFGTNASNQFSSKISFGNNTTAPTGNTKSPPANIFGGNKPADSNVKPTDVKADVSFLQTDNSLSFSTLAAQTSEAQKPAFKTDPNFTFEGAGASVFGAKTTQKVATKKSPHTKKEKNKKAGDDDEEGDEENENGDEHDPYFEPIIPLPDAIEVRTGEEDEEKVFCQRAKLYRYDQNTKEWKERGTGEMKLLHHTQHGTYRLLLRREQVHKVVCNLLLTPDLEFRTLNSSDRAWVWAGMNYAEPDNPIVEQLAVRFKSPELAVQFKEAVDNAQSALAIKQNQGARGNYDDNQEDEYDDDYPEGDDYEDEEDEDEDDDVEDYDGSHEGDQSWKEEKMFEKRATLYAQNEGELAWQHLAMGNLKVIYDSEIFGARVVMENDNKVLASDTLISMDTSMQCVEKECTWAAIDYAVDPPVKRTLRAVFSSTQTSQEMYQTFLEGHECATKADIRE